VGPWGIAFTDYELWGFNDGEYLHRTRLPRFWAWTFGVALAIEGKATP
jgi:hypothetical protein